MRYPEGHKETVRARIVEAAATALRRDGLDGVSIPALMKEVGLTHGGFYAHFEDRDALVAEAVSLAAEQTAERVFDAQPDLEHVLEAYLSTEHCTHPEAGCVLAALGTDGARASTPVRQAFARAARGFLRLVAARLGGSRRALSDESLALASQMIGAVVLARLVDDRTLARRLLSVARTPPAH